MKLASFLRRRKCRPLVTPAANEPRLSLKDRKQDTDTGYGPIALTATATPTPAPVPPPTPPPNPKPHLPRNLAPPGRKCLPRDQRYHLRSICNVDEALVQSIHTMQKSERLYFLRKLMAANSIDYYVITRTDEYGRQDGTLAWISGFAGDSDAVGIVSQHDACLFVDQGECDPKPTCPHNGWVTLPAAHGSQSPNWMKWVATNPDNSNIGFDVRCMRYDTFKLLKSHLESKKITTKFVVCDFVFIMGMLHLDEPQFIGVKSIPAFDPKRRIKRLQHWVESQNLAPVDDDPRNKPRKYDGVLFTCPTSIAYIVYLRGYIAFPAYLYVGLRDCRLFIRHHIYSDLLYHIANIGVRLENREKLPQFFGDRMWGSGKILLFPDISCLVTSRIPERFYTITDSPIERLKYVEDATRESVLEWSRHAHYMYHANGVNTSDIKFDLDKVMQHMSFLSTSQPIEKDDIVREFPTLLLTWLREIMTSPEARHQILDMQSEGVTVFTTSVQQVLDAWSCDDWRMSLLFPGIPKTELIVLCEEMEGFRDLILSEMK
ncbi:hypothetical protein JAAARDRAFT_200794 [Jaapia argillacea MUCL 33604]|uniref:Creatinase N-terminal domain-containing protein n=1 Tax=Jaapia argillacea MUCL 33604 TaxID=933084 RepID=A0A067P6S9_9AGAM|nr:hypothetical protein JAAARDRAFT_200794 [Jaapia argillacea MUCL 33604]